MLPTTPRLTLRELARDDLDFVAGMLGDPQVMRYYPKVLTQLEAEGWIERQLERCRRDGHELVAGDRARDLATGIAATPPRPHAPCVSVPFARLRRRG